MKLELRGITKRFGALVANDHIDLVVEPGEIHCLLGENGAGKSTLMNVLYGFYQADEGEILLDDVVQHFSGPGDAMNAGIGMVHQHFMLIPVFTVAENVMLGVDSDLAVSDPSVADLVLVSIMKRIDTAVYDATMAAANDEFDVTPYIGTLENDGVGLSSFHDFESQLPEGLTDELDALKEQIISGDLEVTSPSSP